MNEVPSGSLQVSRFSTSSFRPHERVAAWSEALGRHCGVRIDINPRSAEDFRQSARIARASTFGLIEGSTSPIRQESSRSSIVNDDVTFCSVTTSRWGVSQLGRSPDLHPGDWTLISNNDVNLITVPEQGRHLGLCVPRAAIKPLVPDIGATFARRIPASSPALQMLVRYLELARIVTTPELTKAFTDHVCDLLALTVGATHDAAHIASTRGVYAARLHAMKEDIRTSLNRPDLSVQSIAARHKVSVRYVQKLFEESGSTFTQFLMEQRLDAAYQALTTSSHLPINTIVYDLGFSDVPNFNRVFRRRYGCTPSDVRNAARLNGHQG